MLMWSPNTARVLASCFSMGVPVKPMKEALGSASRMWAAKPSMKSYWLRWASSAITTMLRRSDSRGCRSPLSSGKNFWMVVNTTPPEAVSSKCRRSALVWACTGGWRSTSAQREKVENSWSSRSFRSVSTTTVGLDMAGSRMIRPA